MTLDVEGVGELVKIAAERGRATRPDIKLGVCGEHGGDPASIAFCESVHLDYVSCSPFRIPIARLAAAQAALGTQGGLDGVTQGSCTRARRARPLRDAQPDITDRPASARPGTPAPLYPGSPSPVLARRPARNHGQTGLGEAGYTRPPVPRLAEPGPGETPSQESRTDRPRRGRVHPPPCTRARRARSWRDAQPEITDRPASARPGTPAPLYPGSPSPASPRRPARTSRTDRPRRGRVHPRPCTRPRRGRSWRDAQPEITDRPASARPGTRALVPGLAEAGLGETPGRKSRTGRPRRGRVHRRLLYPRGPYCCCCIAASIAPIF